MVDQTKLKLFTFIAIGLVSAVYIFSVIEHEDGLGKVCLILLVCLGLTLPIVILNFNDSTVSLHSQFIPSIILLL